MTSTHSMCALGAHAVWDSVSHCCPQARPEPGCGHSRLQCDTMSGSYGANVVWCFSLMTKPGSAVVQSKQFAIISYFPHTTEKYSHGRPAVRNPETRFFPHETRTALGLTQHLRITLRRLQLFGNWTSISLPSLLEHRATHCVSTENLTIAIKLEVELSVQGSLRLRGAELGDPTHMHLHPAR